MTLLPLPPSTSAAPPAAVLAPPPADLVAARNLAGPERHFATQHLLANLKTRTVSSAVVTAVAQGVLFVLTLGSTMVLARLLLPADFGLVAMAMTAVGFLRNFKNAGLSSATVQREGITHAQVSNLFWINAGASAVIAVVVAACAPLVAWFYRQHELVGITSVLAVTFLLEGLAVQHTALLNRQMRFMALAVIQISALVASVAVGIGMAWRDCGYWSLVGAQVTQPFVTLVLTWSVSRWRPQRPTARSGTRPLVAFGLNLTASSFMYSIAGGTDGLLIGRYYGAGTVGLYSRAGALLRRPLDQFLSPINAVFIPVLSRIQHQPDRYRRTFLQSFEAIAVVAFGASGLCLALSRPITLVVLGPKWAEAAPIFAAFSAAAVSRPLTATCSWLFESQGRGKEFLVTSVTSSAVTIASVLVGLPFGAVGVALAYSLSGLLIQLPLFFQLSGRAGPVTTRALWAAVLRQAPVWVVTFAATAAVAHWVGREPPLAKVAIAGTVGGIVTGIFMLLYPPSRHATVAMVNGVRHLKRR